MHERLHSRVYRSIDLEHTLEDDVRKREKHHGRSRRFNATRGIQVRTGSTALRLQWFCRASQLYGNNYGSTDDSSATDYRQVQSSLQFFFFFFHFLITSRSLKYKKRKHFNAIKLKSSVCSWTRKMFLFIEENYRFKNCYKKKLLLKWQSKEKKINVFWNFLLHNFLIVYSRND